MSSTTRSQKQIGRDGPFVSAMGFGAMGLSTAYYGTDPLADEDAFKVLDAVVDRGITLIDTADGYGNNEEMIGRWLKKNPALREKIFIATKFGPTLNDKGEIEMRGDPEYVSQATERSLSKLGVDCIDLYYIHRIDQRVPIEKTMRALKKLVDQGKIKYIGISECSAETLRRACKIHHVSAYQVEYSPFCLDIEDEKISLLKTCRELGIAIIAYSPLGRGMLTGQIRSRSDLKETDFRYHIARFSEENFPKNVKMVDDLNEIAKRKGCTSSQLVLAWLMAQGSDVIPIPGTKNIKYLDQNVGAFNVELPSEEEAKIRDIIHAADISGDRYPPALMKNLFADTPLEEA